MTVDNEMIKKARLGDKKAIEDLVLGLEPLILSSIKKYHYRANEFDDLVQEGRLEVLKCLEDFDPARSVHFLAYVKASLKYLYLEKNREKVLLSLDYEDEDGRSLTDQLRDEGDLEEDLVLREDAKKLRRLMEDLTPLEAQVLVAYYFHGLSMVDIGRARGCSYRTVVNNKARALKKLKRSWGLIGKE